MSRGEALPAPPVEIAMDVLRVQRIVLEAARLAGFKLATEEDRLAILRRPHIRALKGHLAQAEQNIDRQGGTA